MDSWLILIIVIAGVLVLYLLFALIAYFLMKGAMNKAYNALVALIPYEKERLELVKKVADDLKNDHYRFSSQIDELIKENENVRRIHFRRYRQEGHRYGIRREVPQSRQYTVRRSP